MPKTPDYFPGTRYEDSIVFLSGTTLPANSGEIIYVSTSASGSGFFVDELGVIKHLTAPILTGGVGVMIVTDSIGNVVTASIDNSVVATLSGSSFFGPVLATGGLSGSLQRTTSGLSYLVAGLNVTITSQSNGQIVVAAATSGSSGPTTTAPTTPTSNQLGEVFLATVSSSLYRKSLPITTVNGWLVNDLGMMLVTTSSLDPNYLTAGTVYVSGADVSASYLTIGFTGSLPNGRVITPGIGLLFTDAGPGGTYQFRIDNGVVATVSGTRFVGPVQAGILSGSLQQTTGGLSYLVAGVGLAITSQSNGQVIITNTASGADSAASYVVISTTSSLANERSLTVGTGLVLTDAGANSTVTLGINDGVLATLSGSRFTGPVSASAGLSGSLQQLAAGLSYLVAGANIFIFSQSNGQIVVTAVSMGDPNPSYLTLASSSSLSHGRVFSVTGSALTATDTGTTLSLDITSTGTQGVYGQPIAVNAKGQITSGSTSWFGQNFQFVTGVLPINNVTTTLTSGLSMTGSGLTAGIYRLSWSYLYRCNSVSVSFISKIFVGTTSSFAAQHQPTAATVSELDIHSGFTYLRVTGSTQTFDLRFGLSATATNTTASMLDRSFELWRVS